MGGGAWSFDAYQASNCCGWQRFEWQTTVADVAAHPDPDRTPRPPDTMSREDRLRSPRVPLPTPQWSAVNPAAARAGSSNESQNGGAAGPGMVSTISDWLQMASAWLAAVQDGNAAHPKFATVLFFAYLSFCSCLFNPFSDANLKALNTASITSSDHPR